MANKYIGKVYDGRWKVIRFESYGYKNKCRGKYILKNIYNDRETSVQDDTLRKIDRGETTVSRVIMYKIDREKSHVFKIRF